jgi:hypothetical protein
MSDVEKALLWVIYEQCVYAGKVYARLLIHGKEAFAAIGLEDGCDVDEIEKRLFGERKED